MFKSYPENIFKCLPILGIGLIIRYITRLSGFLVQVHKAHISEEREQSGCKKVKGSTMYFQYIQAKG